MRRNILITGASSGLGAEMARQYAAMGRNLALCARRTDRLEELRTDLTARYPGIKVLVRQLDVDDHDAVFTTFQAFADELGTLDRVVVNAGRGGGKAVGTGGFKENTEVATTNFVSALAQCEAAVEIFRRQDNGHLVVISSLMAVRGFAGAGMVYAATKAAISNLAEGIRADVYRTPIKVTTIQPGFIATDINKDVKTPLKAKIEPGVRSIIRASEREQAVANVPGWPWSVIGPIMRLVPMPVWARLR
ncbi:SDR family oxidoreductase [Kibdelosporangium lantanae]